MFKAGSPSAIAESTVARFPEVRIKSQLVRYQGKATAIPIVQELNSCSSRNHRRFDKKLIRTYSKGKNRKNKAVCFIKTAKPKDIPHKIPKIQLCSLLLLKK